MAVKHLPGGICPKHCAIVHAWESVSIVNQHLLVPRMCVHAQCAGYWSCMYACEIWAENQSSLWIVVYCYWHSQWRGSHVGMSTMGALLAERSGLNRSNCDLMFCLSSNWAGEIPVVLCRVLVVNEQQLGNSLRQTPFSPRLVLPLCQSIERLIDLKNSFFNDSV